MTEAKSMEDLVSLCKRRGFVYPASEIYGGLNGFWDYGPLGTQLKNNLRDAWWQDNVLCPPTGPDGEPVQIVGLDSSIIQNPKVWEASGHVGGFNDPMVDCTESKKRYRADKAWVVGFFSARDFDDRERSLREWASSHQIGQEFADALARLNAEALPVESGYLITSALSKMVNALADRYEAATDFIPSFWKSLTPTLCYAVESDSEMQAILVAHESMKKRQREQIGDNWRVAACPQISLIPGFPRLSPATQAPTLTEPRLFNLMFETYVGAIRDENSKAYLRPETAQGIFINFKNVMDTSRVKMPFGIAQVGKSFRNEVTPRNFIFRSREFEQMEMEFFCHPDEAKMWFEFWRDQRMAWWKSIGLTGSDLQLRQHDADELSHYAKEGVGTADVEYRYPFTSPDFGELEGIAHRTDFDLRQHAEHSGLGDKLKAFDPSRGELAKNGQPKGERFFPHVIEPAAGLTRGVLAVLCEAYTRDETRASPEIMKFHPRLAPTKAAVFPLVNKDGMPEVANKLVAELRKRFGRFGMIETDAKQSIGKRYARMDEAGCPFCFTIDGETLSDQTVTVRDRDTAGQERISLDQVSGYLGERLGL